MNWVFRFQRRGNRRKILFTEWIKICCVLFFCFDVYFSLNFISWIECKLGNTKLWDDIQLDDGFWTADLWHRQWPLYQQCHNQCLIGSVTSKKLPNAYKSCSKMISLEKLKILTPLQKLPKNVGDLGKLIVAIVFEKLPKVQ